MSGIIWLASYPKSGNTWFRVFLSNLLSGKDEPASINSLEGGPIASARDVFDDAVGIEASDLTFAEIDAIRPDVYLYLAEHAEEPLFMKVHDAYTFLPEGRPLIPAEATRGAIYFVRNPLDVAVSFAHHSNSHIDKSIAQMADRDYCFCAKPRSLANQMRQRLLSWSGHVESWVDDAPFPVHIMRYEDMLESPVETFSGAVRFAGLDHGEEAIQKALRFSEFRELKRQEEKSGFREKAPDALSFFREGRKDSWSSVLNAEQVARLVRDHGPVMKRFGYLEDGAIPSHSARETADAGSCASCTATAGGRLR